jgi:hypothetical protein
LSFCKGGGEKKNRKEKKGVRETKEGRGMIKGKKRGTTKEAKQKQNRKTQQQKRTEKERQQNRNEFSDQSTYLDNIDFDQSGSVEEAQSSGVVAAAIAVGRSDALVVSRRRGRRRGGRGGRRGRGRGRGVVGRAVVVVLLLLLEEENSRLEQTIVVKGEEGRGVIERVHQRLHVATKTAEFTIERAGKHLELVEGL